MNNLLKHWLIKYQNREEGFTFLEVLVAMIILMMALAFNGQMVLMLKMENLKQERENAAVAVGKDILDDLRFQLATNITNVAITGMTPERQKSDSWSDSKGKFGDMFEADVYVCTDAPTIDNSTDPNQLKVTGCPSSSSDRLIRYLVVQVINKNNNDEKIYTVQTNFAQLQR